MAWSRVKSRPFKIKWLFVVADPRAQVALDLWPTAGRICVIPRPPRVLSHGASSFCWYALIVQLGPTQCVTYTDAHSQEGRADIWYMRAMINRLIRNGLIEFTLHIKNWKHTWQHLLCAWACMWLAACVFRPSTYLPAVIRAIFLSDHWAAKRLPETWLFISIPKELRQQEGAALFKNVASNSFVSK